MKRNVKQTFETIAVAVLCAMLFVSMYKGCSGIVKTLKDKKIEIKKAQEKNTVKTLQFNQRVR